LVKTGNNPIGIREAEVVSTLTENLKEAIDKYFNLSFASSELSGRQHYA